LGDGGLLAVCCDRHVPEAQDPRLVQSACRNNVHFANSRFVGNGGSNIYLYRSTDGADVLQCRTALPDGSITGDTCPRAGALDQDIYGDRRPSTSDYRRMPRPLEGHPRAWPALRGIGGR
jgi:hypothetical protein